MWVCFPISESLPAAIEMGGTATFRENVWNVYFYIAKVSLAMRECTDDAHF